MSRLVSFWFIFTKYMVIYPAGNLRTDDKKIKEQNDLSISIEESFIDKIENVINFFEADPASYSLEEIVTTLFDFIL